MCAGVDVGKTNKQTEVNEKDYRITGERKENTNLDLCEQMYNTRMILHSANYAKSVSN